MILKPHKKYKNEKQVNMLIIKRKNKFRGGGVKYFLPFKK